MVVHVSNQSHLAKRFLFNDLSWAVFCEKKNLASAGTAPYVF